MRRRAIRVRLTAWFAVAVLVIVTPFAATLLALQWRSAVDALEHHLREDLEVVLQLLRPTSAGLGWAYDGDVDPGYDAGAQRWVEVYDRHGKLLYARGVARRPDIRRLLSAPSPGAPAFDTWRTPAGAYVRLHTAERDLAGAPVVVRVGRSEDEIRDQWARLALTFVLAIPLGALAAAAAGYVIAGRALAPIARLIDRARSINAEQLSERLPVENPDDELGELARVFNRTLERLEEAFERLKRFTADASHELRTPLTALRSVGEVGLREPRSPEAYREIIGSMLEEADRLTRLVSSLLLLSRWEAGQMRLRRGPVDLAAVARDVVSQLCVLAEDKRIEVSVTGAGSALVIADADMLRQAVVNLVDNAIKYAPLDGRVQLEVRSAGAACELHVVDNGPGIPAADVLRVFERFYRVDKGRGRDEGGVGLGLAIARRAVESNGGRLDVRSDPGRGSRFIMALPAAAPA